MYHAAEHSDMEKLFWGWNEALPIQRATAFFYYSGSNREILMQLKYKRNPDIGFYLASQFAKEIKDSNFFDGIDVIIPIPLNWIRRMKRGYNQSEYIARGISYVTGIPVYTKAVKRVRNNKSQTRMKHHERYDNVQNLFRLVHPEFIEGKHVLLVDDVTTTGATITSCAKEIAKAKNTKITVLTIAIAGQSVVPQNDSPQMPYISLSKEQISRL